MDDLISRQAAIEEVEFGITYAKALDMETGEVRELFKASNEELRKAVERIKALPTAEPRNGKWIEDDDATVRGHCSVCGWESHYYEDDVVGANYCPNCGARMEE